MTISTYAELQTAVADWHHRNVTQIPDFIALAEKRINSRLNSRLAEVDTTLTGTVNSRYIATPTRFMSAIGIWLTTYLPRIELPYLTPEQISVSNSSGLPSYYTVDGSNIAFDTPCNIAYTFTLRYKQCYAIASTSTNDILTNYPNVYLFGALVEACSFARDYNDMQLFESRFQTALEEAQNAEFANKSNATLLNEMAGRQATNNIIDGGI